MGGVGFVQEGGKGAGVFFSPASTGDAGHDVGIEVHTRFLDAMDGAARPVVPVVLIHELQHVVQTAFDTQIQMAHAGTGKPCQLFVGLAPDSRYRRIHVDRAAIGKVFMNQADYLFQVTHREIEGVPVAQEYFLGLSSDRTDARKFRLDLFEGENTERQVPEQVAELASVIRAAHHDGKHERGALLRRPADLSLVLHEDTFPHKPISHPT